MKKLLAILLALVMVIGLAACKRDSGNNNSTDGNDTRKWAGKTLKISMGISGSEEMMNDWFNKEIVAFEAATGAKVEAQFLSTTDLNVKQKTDLIGGNSADIIYVTASTFTDYYSTGYLLKLDDYLDAEITSDWNFYDKLALNGEHYVAPFAGGLAYRVVVMNVDLCKKLGLEVPAQDELTWDLLVAYSKKAIEAGYQGYNAPFAKDENALIHNFYSYVYQAGGAFVSEENKFDFSDPACLQALEFVNQMFNVDKIIDTVANDAAATTAAFKEGKTLFATTNLGGFNTNYTKPETGYTFEVAPYNLRNEHCGAFNTVDSLAITSTTKEPELAAEFIKFALSTEVYQSWKDSCNQPSANAIASVHAAENLCEPAQAIIADLDCEYFPAFMDSNAPQIIETLIAQQQLVALGDVTPQRAIDTLQALVDSLK